MISLNTKQKNTSFVVRALKGGNSLPLLEWVKMSESTFYKIGYAYFYDQADIESVLIKTMQQMYESVHSLSNADLFKDWVISTYLEQSEQHRTVNLRQDSTPRMKELLTVLDRQTREMIVLNVYGSFTYEEIAQLLDVPKSQVISKSYKGLKYIQACY
ncbi:sigma factor-like helix-turn-helix DNA-binding protein [Salipaludibacillus sp. HK11]|uniref:sigma factor-like helix-turn-helix DNA-binding protein n=1 Tax=Salipaludibacillus sp. HK11 TaxID=3394320 RepID=UPI0039FDBCCB